MEIEIEFMKMVITSDFIFVSFGSGFIYRFGLSLFSIQALICTEWGSSNQDLAYRIPSIGGVVITYYATDSA